MNKQPTNDTSSSPSPSLKKNKRNKDILLSKALSWVLRHGAPKLGLTISTDGYIPLQILLKSQTRNLNTYAMDDVIRVVETNDKQRFSLCMKKVKWEDEKQSKYSFVLSSTDNYNDHNDNCGDERKNRTEEVLCIRANQGHSLSGINCEELLTLITSQELAEMSFIIHGTNKNAWEEHIQHEGLSKMNRNHIHFASGLPGEDGVISGMRKSSQVYIYINAKACARDGIPFYRSENGVILCPGLENGILPAQYFDKVIDANTNESLLQ